MHIKYIIASLFIGAFCSGPLLAQDTTPDAGTQLPDTVSGALSEEINLPFKKVADRNTTGAITVINPEELLQYDNISGVQTAIQGRVPGLMGGLNLRGLGDALVVIDGIPRPLSSINLQEIDQITVLKDASASILYGTQAKNGVIMITTKRGIPNQPKTSVWVEYGVGSAVSLPSYLNSADYMELYNEALDNDGLNALYTPEQIDATRSGTDPLRYPDADYYNSTFLNNTRPHATAVAEFSGGDEKAQYYVNVGWLNSGSLVNLGNEDYNRINLRSNINFRINNFIKSYINVVAIFDSNKGPNGNFWSDAATLRPNLYSPLIDSSRVSSSELLQAATLIDGRYLLGGTSQYQNNIYGNLLLGGYRNDISATGQFNNGIDVDLSSIVKGLSLKTLVSFDYTKNFVEGQDNQYAVYETFWSEGDNGEEILELTQIGSDRFSGTQSLSDAGIMRRIGFYGALHYSRLFGDKHHFSGMILAYADKFQQTEILQDDNHTHLGANLNYIYDNKYILDFSGALVSSAKLPEGNRMGFSPSLALGWVLSEEDFLSNNAVVDFLKLNVSASSINTDLSISDYYLYKNSFVQGNEFSWGDGTRDNNTTVFSNVGNSDLFYEKREEINLGAEALLFNRSLALDANVFWGRITDQLTRRNNQSPAYLGGFVPFENFGEDKYTGVEIGATWNKSFGEFSMGIGLNMAYINTEAVTRDELWEYDYQYRAGNPVNALFGLEAEGLFLDEADINSHAVQSFGTVQPGDIKYADQNDDGVVDLNDQVMIGNNAPDIAGGLNIRLTYKNFTLFGIATAQNGADRYYDNQYYWVYGDRKYSEAVLNRWTPETAATATYPRLTSQANSNNYRPSTYWLYDNSRITLDRVQLNYDFPTNFGSGLGINRFGLYVRASNLVTLAENQDRITLNVGSEPQYRSYSLGLKVLF